MKNGFFSTYQKENCCSDHFDFKTPDDNLFCPLQLRIIITRNHNLIMVSKSVGHQFWFKQNWRRVGFYRNNFLNHATTTVIITAQILKILRLLKLKNCISNVWSAQDWLTWLTRLLYWKFNLRFLGHFYTLGKSGKSRKTSSISNSRNFRAKWADIFLARKFKLIFFFKDF